MAASHMIVAWSRTHGHKKLPKHWKLTRARLCLKTNSYCHFLGKGWHTSVLLGFLEDFLQQEHVQADPLLHNCVWAANNVIGLLYQSRTENGLLMDDQDIKQIQAVGILFLETYMQLHAKYQGFCGYKLWNLRPKTHLWQHLLESCSRIRNPLAGSCWMDEDWLRGVMAVARKTHASKTHSSTLKRYCAGLCSVKCLSFKCDCASSSPYTCMHLFCRIEVPFGEEKQQSEPYISTIRIAFDNSWSESLVSGSEIVHMHVRTFCHVLFPCHGG